MCVVLCCHLSAFVKPFTNNNLHFCWGDLFLFFVLSVCFFWQGGLGISLSDGNISLENWNWFRVL